MPCPGQQLPGLRPPAATLMRQPSTNTCPRPPGPDSGAAATESSHPPIRDLPPLRQLPAPPQKACSKRTRNQASGRPRIVAALLAPNARSRETTSKHDRDRSSASPGELAPHRRARVWTIPHERQANTTSVRPSSIASREPARAKSDNHTCPSPGHKPAPRTSMGDSNPALHPRPNPFTDSQREKAHDRQQTPRWAHVPRNNASNPAYAPRPQTPACTPHNTRIHEIA